MWKDVLDKTNETVPVSLIGGSKELSRSIQEALIYYGYLDPPADGMFGPVSHDSLQQFCYLQGLSLGAGFSKDIAGSLISPKFALPSIKKSGTWIDSIVSSMLDKGYFISRLPGTLNIFYVEGCNKDGSINANKPNEFNDVRGVFQYDTSGAMKYSVWEATTEPGIYWTYKPMNKNGAARIAFGQYKAWQVGKHLAGKPGGHVALVQTGASVKVHRDLDKNFKRNGDAVDIGHFGINQHWGYDMPVDDLGQSSAGCLVGRTTSGHKDFMKIVSADIRYLKNQAYKFYTCITPHPKLHK